MAVSTNFYILNSRILTHVIFWVGYYILFGLIWAREGEYMASFYLEFVLLPIRILAVYLTIYFLLPRYLLRKKYVGFLVGYGLVLLIGGLLQRIFIHLFYENLLLNESEALFSPRMILRAIILINTTVLFVLGIKLFQLWSIEREKNVRRENEVVEIKSNRRIHRVPLSEILYIEGLGNYVKYFLADDSRITAYGTIKQTLESLPENFVRVHKSYIINKEHIKSYDANSIDISNRMIPRGKSVSDDLLLS
ncbi:LytR/AlgR family response regulator transcription factor [Poritiphilus flavus]|uniref:HTH LytTR-type domain-containing protein n=1 Tax=Poritiphilus flavus TaxID=2697053 RepID=A0A6L9ECP7_9FLAO|nr:LytTR family DNA-binding domain-containing protein [Poritiphilus flavus]NAS12520.1 hypothetical protein [Poritiphilus flavus]